MRVIEAPELPNGYRFKVRLDSENDVVIALQKRTWLGTWKTLGIDWSRSSSYKAKGEQVLEVQRRMRMLALENSLDIEVLNETESLIGVYPPRKIIGEVDEL